MLTHAREKALPQSVTLLVADAYDLRRVPGEFDGGLAMFWLSHVPARPISWSGWERTTGPPPTARVEPHGRYCAGSMAGTVRWGSPPRTSSLPPSSRQTSTSLRTPKRFAR